MTIEAAVIVCLLLLVFEMAMSAGIQMYVECRDTAVCIQEEKDMDIIALFYRWKKVGEISDDGDSLY